MVMRRVPDLELMEEERAMERLAFGDNEALDAAMAKWQSARNVLDAARQ
jgi:hypothetical protein